jgi:hypothetical protein
MFMVSSSWVLGGSKSAAQTGGRSPDATLAKRQAAVKYVTVTETVE